MNDIIPFERKLAIMRTEKFNEIADELSGCIKDLPLTHEQNDRLITLIVRQINAAERGAFLQGADIGASAARAFSPT
jgi:hypothetical protein